jgi:acetyl esterase/lipase
MLASDPRYTDPASPHHLPLRAAAGLAGPYDFLPLEGRVLERAFAGTADLPATQPVELVTGAGPPLFLAHGLDDHTVRPANSKALAKAARARGRPVTLALYPGLTHAETLLALGRWWRREAPLLGDLTAFLRDAFDDGARR